MISLRYYFVLIIFIKYINQIQIYNNTLLIKEYTYIYIIILKNNKNNKSINEN